MCGIVAVHYRGSGAIDRDALLAMRDCIAHRGPDDVGLHVDGPVGLGHRRLSIIDLETGHQPMCDSTGTAWIVFNGEIYNFPELRRELVADGYPFKTHSDTEVMLALYRRDGERFVERLNGIFTIALWDAKERRLLLVRDRVGIKPLYLWRGDGMLLAASEIKALLRHPAVDAELDEEAIAEYLAFRQLAGRRTMFKGIETLAPGEMLIADDDAERSVTYWELPPCDGSSPLSMDEAVEQLDELLRDATHMQLISDVPVGTFVSGGVDSSLVTSYVAEKSGEHLNTFCIGLDKPGMDEREYAQLVAEKYRSDHRVLVANDAELADALPSVVWHNDEPLTHPNTLPIYLLSQMAKRHVKVVLTGEGCDEFFGGYPRYRIGAGLESLGPLGGRAGRILASWLPAPPDNTPRGKLIASLRKGADRAVMEVGRYVADRDLRRVLSGDFESVRTARRLFEGSERYDVVSRMLMQDQRNYLMPILGRLDKATMAFGLEARVPFLDHRIIEFAATLPARLKVTHTANKRLVKALALRRLPESIVTRKKSGLALPLCDWLRDPSGMGRYLDTLLEPRSRQRGYLDGNELERLVGRHRSGAADHSELLWALINLELWQRVLVEESSVPAAVAS